MKLNFRIEHILLFTALFCMVFLGAWGVVESSEARYAEMSWEMYRSHDYLHPTLLGIQHYHKPPFTYWLTAFSYHLLGPTPFAARFFLQIALLIQIFLVYKIGRILWNDKTIALFAAAIYPAMAIVLVSVRNLTTDAYLNTWILVTVYFWLRFYYKQKTKALYLAALAAGLGFLTKGPAVLTVPPLVVLTCWVVHPLQRKWTWHFVPAIGLFTLVSLSWFLWLEKEGIPILDYFLLHQSIGRYTAGNFNRSQIPGFYLLFAPLLSFPFFLMMLPRLFRRPLNILADRPIQLIFLTWIFGPILFFSISASQLIQYILPVFSGVALAAAWTIKEKGKQFHKNWFIVLFIYQAFLFLNLLVAPHVLTDIKWNVWMIVFPSTIFIICCWLYFYKKWTLQTRFLASALLFNLMLAPYSAQFMKMNPLMVNSVTPLTAFIQEKDLSERQILVYNERLPSMAFHLKKDVLSLANGEVDLNREFQFERNDSYRQHWFDLRTREDQKRLRKKLSQPGVLVTNEVIPDSLNWLTKPFNKENQFDKWTIYY